LQGIFCQKSFAGVGIRFKKNHDQVSISEVLKGSPAARAGIVKNDVIVAIDNIPAGDLSDEKLIEQLRGEPNTRVTLTVSREGQDRPLELSIVRELIQFGSDRSELK
jgi:carboxyl-terminal processing protease